MPAIPPPQKKSAIEQMGRKAWSMLPVQGVQDHRATVVKELGVIPDQQRNHRDGLLMRMKEVGRFIAPTSGWQSRYAP